MSKRAEAIVLTVLLLVLCAAEGAVLFFMTGAGMRFVVGMLLLAPIILSGSKLGVVDQFLQVVSRTIYARRHRRFRSLVEQLLEEVRRLSATAVDGQRGVRSPEKTNELLDSLEVGIRDLVTRIRSTAGEEHDEPLEVP